MKRREFIYLLSGTAVFGPLVSDAQQLDRLRRMGILMSTAEDDSEGKARVAALLEQLQQLGWTEDQNLRIDRRWAAGEPERTRKFAQELVALQPDVIVSQNTAAVPPLIEATRTIPIVFTQVTDPVEAGFVSSMARPGGNITGFTSLESRMSAKWLEVLKEIAPPVARVAFLFNPETSPFRGANFLREANEAGPKFGLGVVATPFRDDSELERAIGEFVKQANGGLVVLPDATTNAHRKAILELAAKHHLPAVYAFRFFVEAGGLVSYGPDHLDQFRRAAGYVDRILKGTKPGDLPVQQPLQLQLHLNLKTAKELNLTIPQSILLRANEVIE
jgi:putative ABC transport system substrate-binding protein